MAINTTSESDTPRDDALILLTAFANIARVAVGDAGKRLIAVLRSSTTALAQATEKTIAGAKATDRAVRRHPYLAIGVALGLGVILGFLCLFCRRDR